MEMRPAAHACDVGEHLALRDNLSGTKSGPRPDVPVLSEDDALGSLVTDQHAALERRIHDVPHDHSVCRSSHRLDARADVDSSVPPDRASCRAASQHSAVAKAPWAAESKAVRSPCRQRKLEGVGALSRSIQLRDWGCGTSRACA